jgi:hypothetical protein
VLAPTSSETFLAGTATGRVLSFSSAGDSTVVQGEGHSNIVTGMAISPTQANIFSVGFDDRVRELSADGHGFLFVFRPLRILCYHDNLGFLFQTRINSNDIPTQVSCDRRRLDSVCDGDQHRGSLPIQSTGVPANSQIYS